MRSRMFTTHLVVALLLITSPVVALLLPAHGAQAQQTAFLITPYYGKKERNSYFDHEYPTYTVAPDNNNNIFTRYDGAHWTPPTPVEVDNCNDGIENRCYDGHNGYDFALSWERTLAAAAGTVSFVGWQNLNCHWGKTCGYGLNIEIDHGNGYVTRYAHLSAAAVSQGQIVSAGQIIGTSGNSGNTGASDACPTCGAHLHFDVRRSDNNRNVDPFGWTGAGNDPWAVHASGATSWFMWSGGEWAGSPIPNPTPVGSPETIVDDTTNNTGGFSKGSGGPFNNVCQNDCGGWISQNFTGFPAGLDGHMYYTPANGTGSGDQWAKWQPTLPKPAVYEVWVFVPNTNATSYQATYTIQTPSGSYTARVDQYGLNNQWVNIGAYHLLNGSSAYGYITDATGEASTTRQVGVDAVKLVQRPSFVSYLPEIKANGGWTSQVIVRNNGSSVATAYVSFLTSNGTYNCGGSNTLSSQATWTVSTSCGGGTSTSAVVDANQDVSVLMNKQTSTQAASYNGLSSSGIGGPAFRVGRTIYTPLSLAQYGNWHTIIVIQNAGSSNASISINYYDLYGSLVRTFSTSLDPGASGIYDANDLFSPGYNFSGTAVVTSTNQDVAVVVNETNGSMTGTYNGVSVGGTTLYLPLILKGWGVWTTGIQVQNLDLNCTANVTITYYNNDGTPVTTPPPQTFSINPRGFRNVAPNVNNNWSGVAKVTNANSNCNLAAEVDEYQPATPPTETGDLQSYNGLGWASSIAYLPDVRNTTTWDSGLIIQNVSGASSQVTLSVNGIQTWPVGGASGRIPAHGWVSLGTAYIPASGQAVVQSTDGQPLVVEVDNYWNTTGDMLMSYTGFNR